MALAAAFGLQLARPAKAFARGDDVETLATRIAELETRVRELDIQIKPAPAAADAAERRLIDAQILFELKNYDAAAIILTDVVERFPSTPTWSEAMFFLADCLYEKHDYLSSRQFFEKLISAGPGVRKYSDALERLVELSLHTGDYGPVDGYLKMLEEQPRASVRASTPYVKGKYYFVRGKHDDAMAALSAVPASSDYYFQAQYFVGASRVARGELDLAVDVYSRLVKLEAKGETQEKVAALANLALGRLSYERGALADARFFYERLDERSDSYADALYERAWVSIKEKDFKKAYRSLDLLLIAKPEGPLTPEVKLLMGRLQILNNEWAEATDSFSRTREEYDSVKRQMDDMLAQRKEVAPPAYFRELIAKNLDKFDLAAVIPADAVKFVAQEPDLSRYNVVATDVSTLQKDLDECEDILLHLDRAVDGPGRINIFPELAQARARAREIQNQLLDLEGRLQTRQRELVASVAGAEAGRLDQVRLEREQVEKQLAEIPKTVDAVLQRISKTKGDFTELDKRATELNVLIANLRAERVAIEKYVKDTGQERQLTDEQRKELRAQIKESQTAEEELTKEHDALRKDIAESTENIGVDDTQMREEERLSKQLEQRLTAEQDVLGGLVGRLSGGERTQADRITQVMTTSRGARMAAAGFDTRLDPIVEQRLQEVRKTIAEERKRVDAVKPPVLVVRTDTIEVGGDVAAVGFASIRDRFYQVVVQSDVGILDVAWALKDTKTKDNDRLVREKKRELKLLEEEFKDVLKE